MRIPAEAAAGTQACAEGAIPATVGRRALAWWIALQNDDGAPATRDALLQWRAAHPDHERAWQRIEDVNGRLHGLSSPIKSAIAQATLTQPRSRGRRQAVKALAVLVFAGGGTWAIQVHTPWREWTAEYRTIRGGRNTVVLDDGTEIILNTDSAINVAYGQTERRVHLITGEILVTTAPDDRAQIRPFLIETRQGQAMALGTRYAVRRLADTTDVAVFKGAVEIRPGDNPGSAYIVQAGQQTAFTSVSGSAPHPADETGIAWSEGLIVARSTALADFLQDLNRYSRMTLDCDPAVAGMRMSGSYPLNDIHRIMDSVAATLGLRLHHEQRWWGREVLRLEPPPRTRRDS